MIQSCAASRRLAFPSPEGSCLQDMTTSNARWDIHLSTSVHSICYDPILTSTGLGRPTRRACGDAQRSRKSCQLSGCQQRWYQFVHRILGLNGELEIITLAPQCLHRVDTNDSAPVVEDLGLVVHGYRMLFEHWHQMVSRIEARKTQAYRKWHRTTATSISQRILSGSDWSRARLGV